MTTYLNDFQVGNNSQFGYGGFSGSGQVFENTLYFYDIENNTTGAFLNYNLSMVTNITADPWFYN